MSIQGLSFDIPRASCSEVELWEEIETLRSRLLVGPNMSSIEVQGVGALTDITRCRGSSETAVHREELSNQYCKKNVLKMRLGGAYTPPN